MQFITMDELRPGMRLARPIYSRKGVLLYERAAVIKDVQSIQNIKSFGLIGLFILEPAEPVPPMSDADLAFERFQTMMTFQIKDELEYILKNKKTDKIPLISAAIIKNYGNLSGKINFFQNLRSVEDYIYKHSLNTAILAAMLTHYLNLPLAEQNETVTAAIVHDVGKLMVSQELLYKKDKSDEERMLVLTAQKNAFALMDQIFNSQPNVRRICAQAENMMHTDEPGKGKMFAGSKVLLVAGEFDKATAVQLDQKPDSEIRTIRRMLADPKRYDATVVNALMQCINLLVPGLSVELNTGEKALVIRENRDILRPVILSFRDNTIIDLADREIYGDLEVVDIMKTMDNRCVMDVNRLRSMGMTV